MSKNNRSTQYDLLSARVDLLDVKTDKALALGRETNAVLKDLLKAQTGAKAREAVTDTKAKAKAPKAKAPVRGNVEKADGQLTRTALRAAMSVHKANGKIPYGLTVTGAIEQGLMNPDGTLGKKAGGKKAAKVVTAKVEPKAKAPKAKGKKAKVQDNHVARVAPRRANGTIAPKAEWDLRRQYEADGAFTKREIDKMVKRDMKRARKA